MSKHTPGPWKFEDDWTIRAPLTSVDPRESNLMADYRGMVVADLTESHGSGAGGSREFAKPEARANAMLLAAAPEMLEVLKDLKPWAEDNELEDCECYEAVPTFKQVEPAKKGQTCDGCIARDILRAIKKAEGKS